MWICVGMPHPSYRIALDGRKYYSRDDLMRMSNVKQWPATHCFLEFAPSMYVRIERDTDLEFACEIVSRYHAETCEVVVPDAGGTQDEVAVNVKSGGDFVVY